METTVHCRIKIIIKQGSSSFDEALNGMLKSLEPLSEQGQTHSQRQRMHVELYGEVFQ